DSGPTAGHRRTRHPDRDGPDPSGARTALTYRRDMRAITIPTPGDADTLVLAEVPTPDLAADELLVKVAAAGVNRADLMQRQGFYPPPPGSSPYPGLEVSGTVTSIGDKVSGWVIGDQVCALLSGGGYADQVAVPSTQ